jgi:hypothetical protein
MDGDEEEYVDVIGHKTTAVNDQLFLIDWKWIVKRYELIGLEHFSSRKS